MDRIEKIFCVILASGLFSAFYACIFPSSAPLAGLVSARNTAYSGNDGAVIQDTTGKQDIAPSREAIPFGDFEQWTLRRIKESAIVGKDSVTVYEIDKEHIIHGNVPYINKESPWATSNAFAKVAGIVKTNVNVRPAPHDTPADVYLKDLYDWVQKETGGSGKPFLITEVGAGGIYGCRTPEKLEIAVNHS